MTTITIPAALQPAFVVTEQTRVCDAQGNILGYYTPTREATDADYEWLMNEITAEEIEFSLKSGTGRPLKEILDELHRKYGP